MKIAFISDVHGNLTSLNEALKQIKNLNADLIYSAGDIVGYGPNPEECVKTFLEHNIRSVFGNHDYAVNHPEMDFRFNAYAKLAVQWTRERLSETSKTYLKSLPMFIEEKNFTVFHGSLDEEDPFSYILMPADSEISFKNMKTQIGFFGHSHVAGCFIQRESGIIDYIPGISGCTLNLKENEKYLINVGSVGQPRDGNPAGGFCIFDTDEKSVEIKRYQYDIDKVYDLIVENGLPRFLGERLYSGV